VKYCYHCGRVTTGEPLFCNFCGRSYDLKLCPRLHVNTRRASICSQCGSHELSTPQPRVPFWATIVLFLIALISGILFSLVSLGLVIFFFARFLFKDDMFVGLAATGFVVGALWCGWTQIPRYFRKAIHRWLQRKEKDEKRN
jgi:RNA polymerase subunit RPABC4/transcription elongation factor Spt4